MCNLIRCDHCRCEQVRYLDGKCIVCQRAFRTNVGDDGLSDQDRAAMDADQQRWIDAGCPEAEDHRSDKEQLWDATLEDWANASPEEQAEMEAAGFNPLRP